MPRRWTRLAPLIVLAVVGCEQHKGPTTYPAGGKVVYPSGAPMSGGAVQFQPQPDASLSSFGEVGNDGRFSLFTIVDGKKIAGAVAGPHRVVVIPPLGADQSVQPATLPDLYTVKPDGGNDFTLLVPRPR